VAVGKLTAAPTASAQLQNVVGAFDDYLDDDFYFNYDIYFDIDCETDTLILKKEIQDYYKDKILTEVEEFFRLDKSPDPKIKKNENAPHKSCMNNKQGISDNITDTFQSQTMCTQNTQNENTTYDIYETKYENKVEENSTHEIDSQTVSGLYENSSDVNPEQNINSNENCYDVANENNECNNFTKQNEDIENKSSADTNSDINIVYFEEKNSIIRGKINEIEIPFLVDTGAAVSVLSNSFWDRHLKLKGLDTSESPVTNIKTVGGHLLHVSGKVT